MTFEIYDIQPTTSGEVYSVQSAAGRGSKKTVRGLVVRQAAFSAAFEIVGELNEPLQGLAVVGAGDQAIWYAVSRKGRLLSNASGAVKATNLKLPQLQGVRVLRSGELAVWGNEGTLAHGSLSGGFTAKKFADGQGVAFVYGLDEAPDGQLVAVGDVGILAGTTDAGFECVRAPEARTLLLGVVALADDDVIVTGTPGLLLRGDPRKDMTRTELPVKKIFDVCRFQGSLYLACGGDGVFRLDGSELVSVEARVAAYRFGANDTDLLVCGMSFAAHFDGTSWVASSDGKVLA